MDTALLYSELPERLLKTEESLQKAIVAYKQACDEEAEALKSYRMAVRTRTLEGKSQQIMASYMQDWVRGHEDIAELKAAELKATGQKNYCKYFIEAYKERIYNYRFLGKVLEEQVRTGV